MRGNGVEEKESNDQARAARATDLMLGFRTMVCFRRLYRINAAVSRGVM